jgi:hypothetical protein
MAETIAMSVDELGWFLKSRGTTNITTKFVYYSKFTFTLNMEFDTLLYHYEVEVEAGGNADDIYRYEVPAKEDGCADFNMIGFVNRACRTPQSVEGRDS